MSNVLVVSSTKVIGGAEIVLKSWIEKNDDNFYILSADKDNVILFYKNIVSQNLKSVIFIKECYPVENKISNIFKFLCNNIKIAFMINKLVRKYNIDIVYGNNSFDCFATLFYKIILNTNIIVINHVHDMLTFKDTGGKILKLLWKKSNAIFVPSISNKNQLIKLGIDKNVINVVYNSVDIESQTKKYNKDVLKLEYNIRKEQKVLLFVGSICERKNVKMYIDIINDKYFIENNFIGIIAGRIDDNRYYNNIMQIIDKIDIEVQVLTDLSHEKVKDLYKISEVLILTSNRDPLPTVILEAMQNKLLVYARNVDGVPEMVTDGYDGFLFDYQADILDIRDYLIKILNLDCKKVVIQNAQNTVKEKFSHKIKKEVVKSIFKKLLDKYRSYI